MLVEISKQASETMSRYDLKVKITFSEDEDERVKRAVTGKYLDVARTLRTEFSHHDNLYKLVNEDKYCKDVKYNGKGRYFYSGDSGFKRFVEDLTERELEKLTEVYAGIIVDDIHNLKEIKNKEMRSVVSLNPIEGRGNDVGLDKVKIQNSAVILGDGKVYTMEIKETQGESLEDIKESIYKDIYEDINSQIKTIKNNYERRITKLKDKFTDTRNKLFVDILKNSKEILENWEFVEEEGELWLKFKNKVNTTSVHFRNNLYQYPGDNEGMDELYVTGLKVRVTPRITSSDVKVTRGKNLHFIGTQRCCIGELEGKPLFEVLRDLPRTLQTANMDSALNMEIKTYLIDKFLNNITQEERNQVTEERVTRSEW
jgi:hypothetical protein